MKNLNKSNREHLVDQLLIAQEATQENGKQYLEIRIRNIKLEFFKRSNAIQNR